MGNVYSVDAWETALQRGLSGGFEGVTRVLDNVLRISTNEQNGQNYGQALEQVFTSPTGVAVPTEGQRALIVMSVADFKKQGALSAATVDAFAGMGFTRPSEAVIAACSGSTYTGPTVNDQP